MVCGVKTMKERRNGNINATELWVLGCYVVGHTVIITNACNLLAKGTTKLSDKHEAFKLYRITKGSLKHGEFNEKNYAKFQKILQDERCYIENHPEQFIQTRLKLRNLLQYIENKLDPTLTSGKVDLDMVQAAKEYGKYRYGIMTGKILDSNDIIDVYSWVTNEKAYELAKEEEEKDLNEKKDAAREEMKRNLINVGATDEQIDSIMKSLDDCFDNTKNVE